MFGGGRLTSHKFILLTKTTWRMGNTPPEFNIDAQNGI